MSDMSILKRIRNGTTTESDARTVEHLMGSHSSKSLRLMVFKWVLLLVGLGTLLLGFAIGGWFF